MAYEIKTWHFPGSNEIEIHWAGNYGAKGEKRAKRHKATPEQIKRQNQINKGIRMRRLIKCNFSPGDYWITLKYPAGTRKPPPEVQKDFTNFIKRLDRAYKKRGVELKWVRRIEVGAKGGIHIHFLVNRLPEGDTDLVVEQAWRYHIYFATIYEEGGYEQLADYIVKKADKDSEESQQLSLFDEDERKTLTSYSCSRNLIRPEPERKEYKARTVRKLIQDGPTPTPGYYIDKQSLYYGINPFTGMSYAKYTEYKLEKTKPPERRQI